MFILCMNLTERLVIIAVKLLNKMLKSDTVLNCFVSLHMPICICMCVSSFMVWGKNLEELCRAEWSGAESTRVE